MSDCSINAMKPKEPPKAMCCKGGEFRCEQPVLYPLGRNRLIYVDRCMIPELQSLWNRGIETGGCCCGHFEEDGFIQVFPEYEDAMRNLGYEKIPPIEVDGQLMGEHAFKPKTKFEFNGYLDIKTELEQRHQQLRQVVKEMYWDVSDSLYDGFETVKKYKSKLEALGVSVDESTRPE